MSRLGDVGDLAVSLDLLAGYVSEPPPEATKIGPLFVNHDDPNDNTAPGRWQTIIGYLDRFLLVVDEFRGKASASPGLFTLTLTASAPIQAKGRRLAASLADGRRFAVHLLGDYAQHIARERLNVSMRVPQGRFLVLMTPELEADVRVVHGWAIEFRDRDRVYQVMHSNRTRKLRPLGPVQTDARFGVVEWRPTKDGVMPDASFASVFLHEAAQVMWGDKKLQSDLPVDMLLRGLQTARASDRRPSSPAPSESRPTHRRRRPRSGG